MSSTPAVMIVGAYTAEMEGRATGLSTMTDLGDHWSRTAECALPSPTYAITHPDQPLLFAVSEGHPSALHSLRIAPDGGLELLSSVDTGGDFACHLAFAPDGKHLVVAHYGSGSVASVRVEADGRLSERRDRWTFSGSGPDPDRQQGPHAHQVVVDGDDLLVADLGTDRIHRLRIDPDGRFAEAGPPVELPPGFGPRHLVVVRDHLVVAGELSAELWLGVRSAAGWSPVQTVPASHRPAPGAIFPSALRHDGDTLYLANRTVGTIAVFDLDHAGSTLTRAVEFDCGGPGPRDLVLSPGLVWVADQTSDRVNVFDRSGPGAPRPVVDFASPSPACIVLLAPAAAR